MHQPGLWVWPAHIEVPAWALWASDLRGRVAAGTACRCACCEYVAQVRRARGALSILGVPCGPE